MGLSMGESSHLAYETIIPGRINMTLDILYTNQYTLY